MIKISNYLIILKISMVFVVNVNSLSKFFPTKKGDTMLHDYRDIISKLKLENARFAKIFAKHSELDDKVLNVTSGREHMDSVVLDSLKKEKLRLKDEIYLMCQAYKKAHL